MTEIEEEISAIDLSRTSTLVFSAGEPTSHPRLGEIAARALARGVARLELHTHAADKPALEKIVAVAGDRLSAVVALHSVDPRLNSALAGRDGVLARTSAGIEYLLASGVPVALTTCLTRANLRELPALPEAVKTRWPDIERLILSWYVPPIVREGGQGLRNDPLYLPPRRGEKILHETLVGARRVGLNVSGSLDWPLVPCLFEAPADLAGLFPHGPGVALEKRRGPCALCLFAGMCTGLSALQRHHARGHPLRPVSDPASPLLRRHTTRFETVESALNKYLQGRERADTADHSPAPRGEVSEVVVRLTERCNQRCPFCCAPSGARDLPEELIEAQLAEAISLAPRVIALSGGEPTLVPEVLLSAVRRLHAARVACISLQTNAVRLAEGPLSAELKATGLREAFVSLHGHCDEIYDQSTGTRGQFELALRGIDALLEVGCRVNVNHVLSIINLAHFEHFVGFLAARFGRRVILTISLAHPVGSDLDRFQALTPRIAALRAPLRRGLERALQVGIEFQGLDGPCGVPYCALGDDPRFHSDEALLTRPSETPEFRHGPPCERCAARPRCLGLRDFQARIHGFGDLEPVD